MLDLVFIALSILFYLTCVGYVVVCDRLMKMRSAMGLDYTIGLLVSIAMLAYLIVAVVKPEKF